MLGSVSGVGNRGAQKGGALLSNILEGNGKFVAGRWVLQKKERKKRRERRVPSRAPRNYLSRLR